MSWLTMKLSERWEKAWLKNKPFISNQHHEYYNRLVDDQLNDLRSGKNTISVTVGRGRSGKSWFNVFFMCFMNWCYYGREEYEPSSSNIEPLKDIYWSVDDFIKASLRSENWFKFIVLEEQGVERYKMDYNKEGVKSVNKLEQIFGVDQTNTLNNLPFLFDIDKGTRLKANYIYVISRPSLKHFQLRYYKKRTNETTEKAKFVFQRFVWDKLPDISKWYPELMAKYEEMKQQYNKKKKLELSGNEISVQATQNITKTYEFNAESDSI